MRLFSLTRDAHAQIYNVMISPRCQGPAIIKDIHVIAPIALWASGKGLQIYISDNDGGGIVDTVTLPKPDGQLIFETLNFKYFSAIPTREPYLATIPALNSVAGAGAVGQQIKLDYPVNKSSFYVKVLMMGENQIIEGMLRVLEGVDLTRFF